MQTSAIAVVLAVYVLLALFWVHAARRVAAGDRRFVAHLIGTQQFFGVGVVWVAASLFGAQPLLAAFVGIFSLVYLAVVLRLVIGTYRAVRSPAPGQDLLQAMVAPFADHMATLMGLMLVGGLLILVALVASAFSIPAS